MNLKLIKKAKKVHKEIQEWVADNSEKYLEALWNFPTYLRVEHNCQVDFDTKSFWYKFEKPWSTLKYNSVTGFYIKVCSTRSDIRDYSYVHLTTEDILFFDKWVEKMKKREEASKRISQYQK